MSADQSRNLRLLKNVMTVGAVLGAVYSITFFLIPNVVLRNVFGYETLPPWEWPRLAGVIFGALTFAEVLVIRRLSDRLDLVWAFVLVDAGIVVSLTWDRLLGTYQGTDLFFWTSVVVSAVFGAAMAILRLRIGSRG